MQIILTVMSFFLVLLFITGIFSSENQRTIKPGIDGDISVLFNEVFKKLILHSESRNHHQPNWS
jgi:hypothetical protein